MCDATCLAYSALDNPVINSLGIWNRLYDRHASSRATRFGATNHHERFIRPVASVYDILDGQYVDKLDPQKMVDGAIRGMVDVLNDPYTNYVDPEYFPFVNQELSGSIEGIG